MSTPDVVITGASRGIGRALALARATRGERLILVARDGAALEEVATAIGDRGGEAKILVGDLGGRASAAALGEALAATLRPGATLVHNAGLWPTRRQLDDDGHERAFVVNHLGPLAMQAPLLEAGLVSRVMVVSAGLIVKGQVDAEATPRGDDFSRFRTYCTTKLCFAAKMRLLAAAHPELDVVVLHPGVVRTDLGSTEGVMGALLRFVKRRWESPEDCAARLSRILDRPRWSPAGEARWLFEEEEQDWPEVALAPATVAAVTRFDDLLHA
ncbi:MAG: SDR family NAD(P)-dependent oxidoreductase [Myxococcales bacterium]|nr:SDR family NAD(P)-dependent oxidoreductase [Myxococcales bacterium]